jgi:hypothetical protein
MLMGWGIGFTSQTPWINYSSDRIFGDWHQDQQLAAVKDDVSGFISLNSSDSTEWQYQKRVTQKRTEKSWSIYNTYSILIYHCEWK